MGKKLKVSIGPHRDRMEVAWVNDASRPTVIDTDLFVGRALVKIRDFVGVTPDGSEPIAMHPSFEGRSRAFEIQLEGRFKKREGVTPYSGEEVHFGSDFDEVVEYPKAAFSAGIRVASWIDPAMRYDFSPPSKRPFIMSPVLTCMNLLAAWPAPNRFSDALVCLRHSEHSADEPHGFASSEADFDLIPVEAVDDPDHAHGKKKVPRSAKRYWRFVGLAGDPKIDAFVEKNRHLLAPRETSTQAAEAIPVPSASQTSTSQEGSDPSKAPRSPDSSASASVATSPVTVTTTPSAATTTARRIRAPSISAPLPDHQISFGAVNHRDSREEAAEVREAKQLQNQVKAMQELETVAEHHDESVKKEEPKSKKHTFGMGGLKSALGVGGKGSKDGSASPKLPSTPPTPVDTSPAEPKIGSQANKSETSLSKTNAPLDVAHAPELKDVDEGDLGFADQLHHLPASHGDHSDPVEDQLGPWRFGDPTTDLLEDNTFVYLNKSVDVAKRRKHFNESGGKHRKDFTFDPDIVYATAFFSPFMNFNTFDLAIGPVHMNVASYFTKMPVRYTLRSTRYVPGAVEEETFVTIAFELVDE